MAPQSMPQFDPLASSDPPETSSERTPLATTLSLADLASVLSGHTGNELSADLALDLVLNDVVEQARLATGANSAAIALKREAEIVCRATTGPSAPDLGVALDLYAGLSGACVQSRSFQRCDDCETDARVDPALCRRLRIRSILVFPVLRHEELLGVIEVFSPKPHAFSDREIQTLQALSRIVIHNLDHVAETLQKSEPRQISATPVPQAPTIEAPGASEAPQVLASPVAVPPVPHRADSWTTFLTILVIGLALVLGWLLGIGSPKKPVASPPKNVVPQKSAASVRTIPQQVPAKSQPVATPTSSTATSSKSSSDAESQKPRDSSSSDLRVYRNGKLIYHQPNQQDSEGNVVAAPGAQTPSSRIVLSSQDASQYLTRRVEPDYPDLAREQHVQGSVELQIVVGKDGAVTSLNVIQGDPQLVNAATAAVRQWQFKPLLSNGRPQEFETLVTVSFRLPG